MTSLRNLRGMNPNEVGIVMINFIHILININKNK
jgi:hypothetical protein